MSEHIFGPNGSYCLYMIHFVTVEQMTSHDWVTHVPTCTSFKQPGTLINSCQNLVFNDIIKKEFTIIPGKKY